jgi:hypothetical protein
MSAFKRILACILSISVFCLGLPMSAHAGIVSTQESIASTASVANRAYVAAFLARDEIRAGLLSQGVDIDAATQRVNAMTNAEIEQLAGRIDQAPADGDILGILFTVFIILLITDILSLTKVFPFTRSVR